jgi:hypothetical protein
MPVIAPVREEPPTVRRGHNGRGRKISATLLNAMRVVAEAPNEWFRIAEYPSRGGASSAANRMRRRDWEALLGFHGGRWEVISRTPEDGGPAGVWARRVVGA